MQHPLLQDGAYATWQTMLERKVVPNEVTQFVLALAFGNNPQLASALVTEAQKLQASSWPPWQSTTSSYLGLFNVMLFNDVIEFINSIVMCSSALDGQLYNVYRVLLLHSCIDHCSPP